MGAEVAVARISTALALALDSAVVFRSGMDWEGVMAPKGVAPFCKYAFSPAAAGAMRVVVMVEGRGWTKQRLRLDSRCRRRGMRCSPPLAHMEGEQHSSLRITLSLCSARQALRPRWLCMHPPCSTASAFSWCSSGMVRLEPVALQRRW